MYVYVYDNQYIICIPIYRYIQCFQNMYLKYCLERKNNLLKNKKKMLNFKIVQKNKKKLKNSNTTTNNFFALLLLLLQTQVSV